MTNFKVVIVIVVFIAISKGSLLSNVFSVFSSGTPNVLSIEKFLSDILNIGKTISESYYLTIGIEFIVVEFAFVVAAVFALFISFIRTFCQDNLSEDSASEIGVNLVKYSTNDIYLKTNKMIC